MGLTEEQGSTKQTLGSCQQLQSYSTRQYVGGKHSLVATIRPT
jgi:hypothetical protein